MHLKEKHLETWLLEQHPLYVLHLVRVMSVVTPCLYIHIFIAYLLAQISFMLFAAFHKMTPLKRWQYQTLCRNGFLLTSDRLSHV